MKKYLGFLALLLAGILVMGCKHSIVEKADNTRKGNVIITIGTGERTVTPVNWSIGGVGEWEITLDCTSDDTVDNIVVTQECSELEASHICEPILAPEGTYTITVEGSGTDASQGDDGVIYTLYGKKENVEISSTNAANLTINVSLRKSEEKTGNFSYTVNLSNSSLLSDYSEDKYNFSAYLSPISDPDDEEKQIALDVAADKTETLLTLTLTEKTTIVDSVSTITKPISSGYYYLTICYVYDEKTFVVPLVDSLVEIADGLTTNGSYSDSDFAGVVTKTFYVDNKELKYDDDNQMFVEDDYNGLIPAYPKDFNMAIKWLDDNQGEWTTANLYFETGDASSATSYEEYVKALVPYYTNECNPTAGEDADDEGNAIYHEGYNKEVNVYIDGSLNYVLKGGYVYITEACVSNPSICFAGSSEHEENVDDHSYAEGYVVYDDGVEDKELTLYQIATMVILNGVKDKAPCIKSIISPEMAKDYDPEDPDAYLKLETTSLADDESYENDNISLAVLKEDGSGTSEGSYTVLTKEESPYLNCYTASAGQVGVTISKAIPDFEISGPDTVKLIDSDTNYVYECVHDSESLGTAYTYTWFLNGSKVSTAEKFVLNPLKNEYAVLDKNNLMVTVTSSDGYSASKTRTFVLDMTTAAIYDGSCLFAADLNTIDASTDLNSLPMITSNFDDFAIDSAGGIYYSFSQNNSDYVVKYGNATIYSISKSSNSGIKLYYDADYDDLYIGYMNANYNADPYTYTVSFVSIENVSKLTSFNPETYNTYGFTSTTLGGFKDFAVYTSGTEGSLVHKPYIIANGKVHDEANETYTYNIYTSSGLTEQAVTAIDMYAYDSDGDSTNDYSASMASDVSDIAVVNGFVYALLNERNTATDYDNFYSRGAVVKIDPEHNTVAAISGYYSENTALDLSESSDVSSDLSAFGEEYFFCPSKFIAIKPKKLYIADDGAYYYSTDDVGNSNRVVEFDLESSTIASGISIDSYFGYEARFITTSATDYPDGIAGTQFNEVYFEATDVSSKYAY